MSMPQDIRISPDGRVFYVAVMGQNRVSIIDGEHLSTVRSIKTPKECMACIPAGMEKCSTSPIAGLGM